MRILNLAVAGSVVVMLAACSTLPPSGTRRVLTIGGQRVEYVFYSCAPAIRYDANTIAVEGLELPTGTSALNRAVNFKVAKVAITPTVQRQIDDYTARYKMLLDETCKSLALMDGPAIERYATHRDNLMSRFINAATKLQEATTEAQVAQITQEALTGVTSQPPQ